MKQEFVAIQYLVPKKLAVIIAATFGSKPPPVIAVMMHRQTKTIELLEVTL